MNKSVSGGPAVTPEVTLCTGAVSASILGGDLLSVSSLRYQDVELLADPGDLPLGYRVHDQRAGITLLHPWANRLGADTFVFGGTESHLDAGGHRLTRDANGLAIHGLTAPAPWRLIQENTGAALASLTWPAEAGFPFAHQVDVTLELSTGSDASATLAVQTVVTALGADPVPVAFGWHPYFRRDAVATIELPDMTELCGDEQGLPSGAETPMRHARMQLGDQTMDYGVSNLATGARMLLHNRAQTIAVQFGQGYRFGQVFAPSDRPIVSFEPMTAPTDALRRATDLPVAEPGRPFRASFVVRVSDGPSRTIPAA